MLSTYEPVETTIDYFDIGLQYGCAAEDRYSVQALADEIVFPVCSKAFAEAHAKDINAGELGNLPLLHLSDTNRGWPTWTDFLVQHDIRHHTTASNPEIYSYQVCINSAEQGEGVALGWGQSVKEAIASGRLVPITGFSIKMQGAICLYQPKHTAPNPLAQDFVNLLTKKLGDRLPAS